MLDGRMNVVQGADDVLGGRSAARTDGRRTFGLAAPAPLQFIQSRVEFTPLAAREKAPLQSVLQPFIVLAVFAAGDLRPRAANVEAVENAMMHGAVVGPPADQAVEPSPIRCRD